jgi:hypothetical protein
MTQPSLREVVARHRKTIMATQGVVGVGGGVSPRDPARRCVLVYVERGGAPVGLPAELDGYPVEVVVAKGGFRPR